MSIFAAFDQNFLWELFLSMFSSVDNERSCILNREKVKCQCKMAGAEENLQVV